MYGGGRIAQNIVSTAPGKISDAGDQVMSWKSVSPADRKLSNKMIGIAKKKYNLDKVPLKNMTGPAIFSTPYAKLAKVVNKVYNSSSKNSMAWDNAKDTMKSNLGERLTDNATNKGKGSIMLFPGINKNRPEVVAHELGHERNARYGFGIARTIIGTGLGNVANEDVGTERRIGQAVLSNVKTAATGIPQLAEEGLASVRGLRLMKKAGANKQQMQTGRQNLKTAFGTYFNNFKYNLASPWANIQDRQDRYKQIMSDRAKRPINNIQK